MPSFETSAPVSASPLFASPTGAAIELAVMGLVKGEDLEGTLACPIAPNPILPLLLPNAPPKGALLDGEFEEEVDAETPARSLNDILVRSCETPGRVGADQISPWPDPLALPLAEAVPDPSGGEEVIQLEPPPMGPEPTGEPPPPPLRPEELTGRPGADQVSLAPKIEDMVLELKGGRPEALLPAPESPGAGPKLSMVGS